MRAVTVTIRMMSARDHLLNWSFGFVLCCFVGFATWLSGDPFGLVAIKVLVTPLWLLANNSIPARYVSNQSRTAGTWQFAEKHIILGMTFSAFLTILLTHSDSDPLIVAVQFVLSAIIYGGGFAFVNAESTQQNKD